jgi:hypothetical protein
MNQTVRAIVPTVSRSLETSTLSARIAATRSGAAAAAGAPRPARVLQTSRAPAQLSLFQRPALAR